MPHPVVGRRHRLGFSTSGGRFIALVSLMLVSAAPLLAQAGAQPTALEQQVLDSERAFARTMAERNLDRFSTFVSEEAVFYGGEILRGRDAVTGGWRQFFDAPKAPFSWDPDHVEVLPSGTLALSSGPVYNPAGERVGTFNSVWRLEADGKWRVVFDKGCS